MNLWMCKIILMISINIFYNYIINNCYYKILIFVQTNISVSIIIKIYKYIDNFSELFVQGLIILNLQNGK